MLNYLWASMMFLGIITGAVTGHMNEVSEALVNASQEAVELCLTMLGVVAMWTGILKIGEKAGLLEAMAVKMQPVIRFLFPGIPKNHPAVGYIATNFVANILGLGWAATPAGLKAMESLSELEKERRALKNGMRADSRSRKKFKVMPEGIASNEMCTFLILNISSLQLIPVNIIAYRSQYKSADPTSIIGPAIAATAVSTAAAIIFCKMMDHLMDQRS
ncbi:MAG: nucleoside recognition protein [Clostridiales bacterium]|nr:nucleoside recognition protein [Clostridiales bacterium]MDY3747912.1 nucleoside recognition domain-containing protein [Lachnospiraceae bacterium]